MRIYTRSGDAGETALFGGGRVPKDHPRIEACGAVDELNAVLGRVISALDDGSATERLSLVQHDLFAIGAYLASPDPDQGGVHRRLPGLPEERAGEMERWIDEADAELEPLTDFVLPGGTSGAAELHVCRTVCRRAERAVVRLSREPGPGGAPGGTESDSPADGAGSPSAFAVRYLNRLSDLLFVLARLENHRAGIPDVTWQRRPR